MDGGIHRPSQPGVHGRRRWSHSGVGNSRQLLRLIQEAGIDAISSTPSYPTHLEGMVRDELGIEPVDLGLKLGLFAGEPGLENPTYRQRIEEPWGIKASNCYGISDVMSSFAAVCQDSNDLHFMGQGSLVAQMIDPASCEDLAVDEGVEGELVLTHLAREAQPLVRYSTSDVIRILATGPCSCGRTGFRFQVTGRSDDMVHVRGINVFPSGVADVLTALTPSVTGEFQILLSHPGPYDRLDIAVEYGEGVRLEGLEQLRQQVEAKIKEALTFSAYVDLVPPDSIPRTEMGKAIRVVRRF